MVPREVAIKNNRSLLFSLPIPLASPSPDARAFSFFSIPTFPTTNFSPTKPLNNPFSHKLTLLPTSSTTPPYARPRKKLPPSPLRNKNFPLPLHPLTETTEPQPRRATKKDLRVRKKIPNFAIRLAVIETAPRRRQRHAH